MNLIIFGLRGSGKGTYASRLSPILGIPRISTGDIFKENIIKKTPLGKKVEALYKTGIYAPDELAIQIVKDRLKEPDAKKGFILDGFPRTIEQAKELNKIVKIDAAINILANKDILVEKATARRICENPKCDGNYNIADIRKTIDGVEYILPPLLPKKDMICDKCGGKLYQKEDDKPDIIRKRLEQDEKFLKPVIKFYGGKMPFIEVHMNRPPEIIVNKILEELKELSLVKTK
jgi:adenylate kinase